MEKRRIVTVPAYLCTLSVFQTPMQLIKNCIKEHSQNWATLFTRQMTCECGKYIVKHLATETEKQPQTFTGIVKDTPQLELLFSTVLYQKTSASGQSHLCQNQESTTTVRPAAAHGITWNFTIHKIVHLQTPKIYTKALLLLDHIACTTYVNAVYCYWLSSVVFRSVGLSALWALHKCLYRSRCHLGCGLEWAQEIVCYLRSRSPWEGTIFEERAIHFIVRNTENSVVTCAKTAEPIVMPFGLWAGTGPRSHELHRGSRPPIRRGNFGRKGRRLQSTETFCRELRKNGWNDRFAIWVVDSGGRKETQVQSYLIRQVVPMYPHRKAHWVPS